MIDHDKTIDDLISELRKHRTDLINQTVLVDARIAALTVLKPKNNTNSPGNVLTQGFS